MARIWKNRVVRTIILTAILVIQSKLSFAETQVGSSVESRITVALAVDSAGLAPWMPDGWAPIAFPGGPLAGANLLMVLADQHAQTDAEGNLKEPSSKRLLIFAGLGRQMEDDRVRFFAYRVYGSDISEDPYGNASLAALARKTATSVNGEGVRKRSEEWSVTPSDGSGSLTLSLEFAGGERNWTRSEANPYSNQVDGFNRIYRYRQLADLAMSAPLGKGLAGEMKYKSDIPDLSKILDGSEAIIAVLDIPVYVREIYLP